jgi:hypothetical protein
MRCASRRVKAFQPLEHYLELLLQDGQLPKDIEVASTRRDIAATRTLVDDARKRLPRRDYLSDKAMADFLRKHGCTGTKVTCRLGIAWVALSTAGASAGRLVEKVRGVVVGQSRATGLAVISFVMIGCGRELRR